MKKDPHHRRGSFFRSRRGSFPRQRFGSRPDFGLRTRLRRIFGPWTFLVSRPNLSRPGVRLGVGSRISWVTFLSKIRDPTQPLVFPPSHFGYDQTAGDLFSPIEKRIPTPAGTKISSPAGIFSPARGSRRTFIAGRAPTRVRRKSPISIQPENSDSYKISFLRAEHFLGSPARGGTPIATRTSASSVEPRQAVERNVHEIENPSGATDDSPSPPTPLPQGARGEEVSTTIRRVERTMGSCGSSPFDRIPSPLSPRGRGAGGEGA